MLIQSISQWKRKCIVFMARAIKHQRMNQTFSRENDAQQWKSWWFDENFFLTKIRNQIQPYCASAYFNEFIRCFHQFDTPIWSTNVSQFEQLKRKTNFLLVQNRIFSQFASWKRNHNKYSFSGIARYILLR